MIIGKICCWDGAFIRKKLTCCCVKTPAIFDKCFIKQNSNLIYRISLVLLIVPYLYFLLVAFKSLHFK